MPQSDQTLQQKIARLRPVFERAVKLDFSQDIDIPSADDDFNEVLVGVQIMLDMIREKIDAYEKLNAGLEQKIKDRTHYLEERNAEIARSNKLMVNREIRMIDLKKQIDQLQAELEICKKKSTTE